MLNGSDDSTTVSSRPGIPPPTPSVKTRNDVTASDRYSETVASPSSPVDRSGFQNTVSRKSSRGPSRSPE
jgi:hypothetical protein